MGDFNQYAWVKQNKERIHSPILEIGSRYYDEATFINYRELFLNMDYTGVDIFDGYNVDVIIDLTSDIIDIKNKLGNKKFKTIICCSVMEHVNDIFTFSNNIEQLLDDDGVLFISVPFTWEFHGYPSDYWRFTPEGIKYLFKNLNFLSGHTISSHLNGDIKELPQNVNEFAYITLTDTPTLFSSEFSILKNLKMVLKFFIIKDFRRRLLIFKWLKTNRLLRVSSINMIGVKQYS